MKKKTVVYILIILIVIFSFNIKSYAVTAPELRITSNSYSDGDKISLEEVTSIEEGKTLQLYAILAYGNDEYIPGDYPDSRGWYVQQANLEGVVWTSSNTSVATIDNNGKLTGIKEGETIITANYSSGRIEEEKTTQITMKITKSENQPSQDQPSEDPNQKENPSREPSKTNTQTPTTTTSSNDNNNSKTYKNGYSSIDEDKAKTTDEDKTTANVKIPKSGLNFTIMIISIIGITLVAILSYEKYKKCIK